jgi:nicotinamidase-related amidase
MSDVHRKDYGGEVQWCETDRYTSFVKFVHPKHTTDKEQGKGISVIVLSGRLKLHRIDDLTGLKYFTVLLTGDSASFNDDESFFIEGIDECHFLEIKAIW